MVASALDKWKKPSSQPNGLSKWKAQPEEEKPKGAWERMLAFTEETSPQRAADLRARNAESAWATGIAQELLNTPGYIANVLPNVNVPEVNLREYAPPGEEYDPFFTTGRVTGAIAPGAGFYGALGKIPYIGKATGIPGYLSNIGKSAATGYALTPKEDKETSAAIGAGLGAVLPPLARAGGLGYRTVRSLLGKGDETDLISKVSPLNIQKRSLETSIGAAKEGAESQEQELARRLAGESQSYGEQIEQRAKRFQDMFPQREEKAIGELTKGLTKVKGDVETKRRQLYQGFGRQTEGGQVDIKEPIKISDFKLDEDVISPEFNEIVKKSIGYTEKAKGINPDLPQSWDVQAKPKVNDYFELWKSARDTSRELADSAKNADNVALKKKYIEQSKQIGNLASKAQAKIRESLTPEKWKEYKRIQNFFENIELPFRESPLLAGATERHPKVAHEDFMKAFIRENKPALRSYIKQNYPDVEKAIVKHDLMATDFRSPAAIDKLLSGDKGKSLGAQTIRELRDLRNVMSQKELVDSLLQKVGQKELALVKSMPELNNVFKRRPELRAPLENISAERARIKELEKELKLVGMEEKEAKEALRLYRQSIGDIGRIGTMIFGPTAYKNVKKASLLLGGEKK